MKNVIYFFLLALSILSCQSNSSKGENQNENQEKNDYCFCYITQFEDYQFDEQRNPLIDIYTNLCCNSFKEQTVYIVYDNINTVPQGDNADTILKEEWNKAYVFFQKDSTLNKCNFLKIEPNE